MRSHKTPERYVFEADVPEDSLLEIDPAERGPQLAPARPLAAGEPPPLQAQPCADEHRAGRHRGAVVDQALPAARTQCG